MKPPHALDRHLALVGFMGAGKTTTAREVAARLDRPFLDTDEEIERRKGRSVQQVFAERGEAAFRALEEEIVRDVLSSALPAVVALGGGAVGSEETRRNLFDRATTVLLEIDVETAWKRSADSGRPLALDEAEFRRLYEERARLYAEVADWDAADAEDVLLAAGGITVEIGALEELGDVVGRGRDAALVSDSRVAGIYGPRAQRALGPTLRSTHELPIGEDAKTLASLERLLRALRLDRTGTLVALGGGCTTDTAGFAAAVYLRGIDWIAVPTTLVGQVDAAIGGKTAINLPEGKNLVGAFHWPVETVIDPSLLSTLPEAERREGLAEVVKTGLLAGETLWELADAELVRRCAAYKTALCLRDPRDEHVRRTLNLGHTFAHALEAGSGYSVRHGEAVALGLLAALRLSERDDSIVREVLDPRPVAASRERVWEAMQRDKKWHGRINLVLLGDDGPEIRFVSEADVRRELDALIAS